MAQHAATLNAISEWPNADWALADLPPDADKARAAIEAGKVLYFPHLAFALEPGEERFLTGRYSDGKAKNISIRPGSASVHGAAGDAADLDALRRMIERYAGQAIALVGRLFPDYVRHMKRAGTSLRTQEIQGRAVSWRKDDTRLHVDAFPSNPVRGVRMLRVFSNIDPDSVPREWTVGEPFADFAARFAPRTKASFTPALWAMWKLGITKQLRSEYDSRMLQLHDLAKADLDYQRSAPQQDIAFPSGATWIVFTDQVLHAAKRGKCMLEQTIYVDGKAIRDKSQSPRDVLERLTGRPML
jgi:hypothetical protein